MWKNVAPTKTPPKCLRGNHTIHTYMHIPIRNKLALSLLLMHEQEEQERRHLGERRLQACKNGKARRESGKGYGLSEFGKKFK